LAAKNQGPRSTADADKSSERDRWVRRHLQAGWLGLVVFMALGLTLEVLHGLKIDFYLDLRHGTRRMLWTLAHTHGTLFSLLNIAFAWTLTQLRSAHPLRAASVALLVGQWVMPLGFFLGGTWLLSGDPGYGILLAPVGGLLVLVSAIGLSMQLMASRA
jgi:hypothetical protein